MVKRIRIFSALLSTTTWVLASCSANQHSGSGTKADNQRVEDQSSDGESTVASVISVEDTDDNTTDETKNEKNDGTKIEKKDVPTEVLTPICSGLLNQSGADGQANAVIGRNFPTNAEVRFGATIMTLTSRSSERLSFTNISNASGASYIYLYVNGAYVCTAGLYTFSPPVVPATPKCSGLQFERGRDGEPNAVLGSDFPTNAEVMFGPMSMAITSRSSSKLSFISPTGSGASYIYLFVNGGYVCTAGLYKFGG